MATTETVPRRFLSYSPDICPRIIIFVTAIGRLLSGGAFIILETYRFCLPFPRITARNKTLGLDNLNSARLPSATFPFTSFGTELLPGESKTSFRNRELNELNVLRTGDTVPDGSNGQDDVRPLLALLSSVRL